MNKILENATKTVLYENYGENICFSPSSLSDCLCILKEIISDELRNKYPEIQEVLISESDEKMEKYNGVLLNQRWDENFSESVVETLEEKFDCQSSFDNLFKLCNNIVCEKTNGRITNILDEGNFDEILTSLVGLNTIYFKAEWTDKFKKYEGTDFLFNGVPCKPLRHNSYFKYHEDDKVDICEIDFRDTETKLYLVIPQKSTFDLIENFSGTIDKCKRVKRDLEVVLKFPEFKIESSFDIKEILLKNGYEELFKYSKGWDLYNEESKKTEFFSSKVSEFNQKTFFEASEKGVEAAAATAFGIAISGCYMDSKPPEYKYINANKSFMFILAKDLDNPEFVGLVNEL